MKNLKNLIVYFSILSVGFYGCIKNNDSYNGGKTPGSVDGDPINLCSTISAQNSVMSNGVTYTINGLSGSANSIGIEVINSNGPFTSNFLCNY
mgnify:CR=1 FL=1